MIKGLSLFGTLCEAIKPAPVIWELRGDGHEFREFSLLIRVNW